MTTPRNVSLSCGIILLNELDEVLLGHATWSKRWDILKGGIEPGETESDAAIREALEESGLLFVSSELRDVGRFEYRPDKQLHLFVAKRSRVDVRLEDCRCTTFFRHALTGRMLPELDSFRWAASEAVAHMCNRKMAKIVQTVMAQDATLNRLAA
jgi:8-oxo-dGTP pyrophosphatase MutT (NUDIX family)